MNMKRESALVAYGTYSLAGTDSYVVRITPTMVRKVAWQGWANQLQETLHRLSLRQIRAKCLAETKSLAEECGAHFDGVRRLVFSELAETLAKTNEVPEWGLRDILERAQAALDGIGRAGKWLRSPCRELKGEIPMELVRTQKGRRRLENLLTRLQFERLIKKECRQCRKTHRQSQR